MMASHERTEHEERSDAIRILLMNPLLPAEGERCEDFRLVLRHSEWLRQWFLRWAGWSLHSTADVVRLRKTPSLKLDSSRGLLDKTSSSDRAYFTRRRYALLCLVLATLENEQRQTTIQRVAQKTVDSIRVNPELQAFGFDPKQLAHRYELIAVMRFLQRSGVLSRADGDDSDYVSGSGDCLYRIDRSALANVPGSIRSASTISISARTKNSSSQIDVADFIERLNEVELPNSTDSQNRNLQHMLVRRLLDDPIMYFDELTANEYDYFNKQGERLLNELERATGLFVERRAEGVALLDPAGDWTDLGLPEVGTRGHATLLLAEWLADGLRESIDGAHCVSLDVVRQRVQQLANEHESRWRKNASTPEGVNQIMDEAIDVLHSLGLVRLLHDAVQVRPAIARYRVAGVGLDDADADEGSSA